MWLLYICLLYIGSIQCDRFTREELGTSDMVRFTSGLYKYYNCTVVGNKLMSNLKIGVYIHDLKTSIEFSINDTDTYVLSTVKIVDFYFAHINVIRTITEKNKYIKLRAKDKRNGAFIDDTILRVFTPKAISSAPTFRNYSITIINIFDDLFVGSVIGKLLAYSHTRQVIFSIDPRYLVLSKEVCVTVDGRILLTRHLSAKKTKKLQFIVNANYMGSSLKSSIIIKIMVKPGIKIKKRIDHSTLQSQYNTKKTRLSAVQEYNISFFELAPKYTIIGSLSTGQRGVAYSIFSNDTKGAVTINGTTGVLSIAASNKVDYEKKKKYNLVILGRLKSDILLEAKVTLHVVDANDNSPVFSENRYVVDMKEDALVGSIILRVSATDKDSGDNGKVSYVLSNREKVPFDVSSDGLIKVTKSLNLMAAKYFLYVKALDWGNPIRRETEVVVEVAISPVNLHYPVMKQTHCNIILTVTKAYAKMMTFTAVDQDVGDKITYKLESSNKLFYLNSSTGVLSLTSDEKPEHNSDAIVHVFASDGVHESRKTPVVVRFTNGIKRIRCTYNKEYEDVKKLIINRQNMKVPIEKLKPSIRPRVDLHFTTSVGKLILREDTALNTFITKFTAIESKTHCYGPVLYIIVTGNLEGKFQIDLLNGTMYLLNNLDRETTPEYKMKIRASDMYGNFKETSIKIIVEDVNDNAPVFTNNGVYHVSIEQDHKILTVKAKDADAGTNGEVVYSLVNPSRLFSLDERTGVFTVKSALAKGSHKDYFIDIQASDRSQEENRVGYAVIHVIVTKLANNPPVCVTDSQKIEIPTNTPAGVVIGRVFGYDPDFGKLGKITYSILQKTLNFDDYFLLSQKTGLITLSKGLSKKDKGFVFNIAVKLQDGGEPSLSTVCHVYKIIVDSLGSMRPSFSHTQFPLRVSVSGSAKGAVVTKLRVSNDNSSTVAVNYELVDGSGVGVFSIDKVIGTVYVSKNEFTKSFYWLTVQAYIETDPSIFTNAAILVKIKNKKTTRPFFSPSVYRVMIPTSNEIQRNVVQLFATFARKSYSNEDLKFAIYAGDSHYFKMREDGWIQTHRVVSAGHYALNVTVTNKRNTTLMSHGHVFINVNDKVIQPPSFGAGDAMITVQVFESRGLKQPPYLFQFLATNPYGDKRKYEIVDKETLFSINSVTAVVKSNQVLNQGELEFVTIRVTDTAEYSEVIRLLVEVIRKPESGTKLSFKESM